jgi:hypothetical protein
MKATTLVAIALAAFVASSTADARPRPQRGQAFHSNKTFGLGLELGAPFGLTGKYFLGEGSDRALDFGIGDIDYFYGDRYGLHIYGDYLFHPVSLVQTEAFELPLYAGIGARFWNFTDRRLNDAGYALGLRVPVGIAFDFNNVPLDVFFQLAFVLDFVRDYGNRSVIGAVDGSIGIRYWFN